jgi:hypothetical protein
MMGFELKNKRAKKLTAGDVAEMRGHYAQGATQGALSRHYGVTIGQVGRIVRGESWQEGAGTRMPTQEEMDETLRRLMLQQQQVDAQQAAGSVDPVAAEVLGGVAPRRAPPSPLDGGDAPSETDGSALVKLAEDAKGTEQGLDKLLGVDGPYSFARKEQK